MSAESDLLELWLQQVTECLYPIPDSGGGLHPCFEAAIDEGEMCCWCRTVRHLGREDEVRERDE